MGRDFRSLHNPENKVADSFLAILEPTKEKIAFLAMNFVLPQWIAQRIPWRLNGVVENETTFLRNMCQEIVTEKKAAITASGATAEELEADILGTMMVGGDFSDSELVDQMLTFLAAGVSILQAILRESLLTSTARNHGQRPHLDLFPPLPVSRCAGASPRRDPRAHPIREHSHHLERA